MSTDDLSFLRRERSIAIRNHKWVMMSVAIVSCVFALCWCIFLSWLFRLYYEAHRDMTRRVERLPFHDAPRGECRGDCEALKVAMRLAEHKGEMFFTFARSSLLSGWFWFLVPFLGYSAISETAFSKFFRFQFSAAYVVCTCFGACVSVFNLIALVLIWGSVVHNHMDMTLQPFRNVPCPVHLHPCGNASGGDAVNCWANLLGWPARQSPRELGWDANRSLLLGTYMYCQPVPELLDCPQPSGRRAWSGSQDFRALQEKAMYRQEASQGGLGGPAPLILSDALAEGAARSDYVMFNANLETNATGRCSSYRPADVVSKCNDRVKRPWCIGYSLHVNSSNSQNRSFYCLHDLHSKLVANSPGEPRLSWIRRDPARLPAPQSLDGCAVNASALESYRDASQEYYDALRSWDTADDWYQRLELPMHFFALGLGLLGCRSGMRFYMSINEGCD